MKTLLTLALCLGSFSAFSDMHEKDWDKMPFEEKKTHMTEKLNKKQTMLDEAKSCVSSAKDDKALKACKEQMKEDKKEMKEKWKDKKKKK